MPKNRVYEGRKSSQDVSDRRRVMIACLGDEPATVPQIMERIASQPSRRNIYKDLEWLMKMFPSHLVVGRSSDKTARGRVTYAWVGAQPYVLEQPIAWLTEDELIALVAARGLLRDPTPPAPVLGKNPAPATPPRKNPLAAAADGLIARANLVDHALLLAKHSISVSRFGAATVDPDVLRTCLAATCTRDALRFDYENLGGERKRVHASPVRVHLSKGDWYCIAWRRNGLTMHHLSRMSNLERTSIHPAQKPASIPDFKVDNQLRAAFFATWDQPRTKVILAVSPEAWPHIVNRRWGDSQKMNMEGGRLKPGWHRLSFMTEGLSECQHWILSMGSSVQVESPDELKTWITAQARAICRAR